MKHTTRTCLLLLLTMALSFPCAAMEEKSYSEEYVKALYLYQLTKFASWKNNPSTHNICVVESDELGATLVQVVRSKGEEHHYNIKEKNLLSELTDCQILYISKYAELEALQILYKTADSNILTVSDISDFIEQGGGIGFTTIDNSVKIEINNTLCKKLGIFIDTELLDIARKVL